MVSGEFGTAPAASSAAKVTFLWSGDLGGGGLCRLVDGGYRIFSVMALRSADFFLFSFLGCRLVVNPAVATERFYTASENWINAIDEPGSSSGQRPSGHCGTRKRSVPGRVHSVLKNSGSSVPQDRVQPLADSRHGRTAL